MKPSKIAAAIKAIMEQPAFCWRCGNRGFWFEQINGPDNLRKVTCDCGSTEK